MKKQSKLSRTVAASLACVLALSSSPINASAAKAPSWGKTTSTMTVGTKYKFTVKNKPAGGKITFSSSKKTIATVNASGVVTAKKAGKSVIKAVVKNKKKKTVKTLKKTVTVKAKRVVTTPTVKPTNTPAGVPTNTPTVTAVSTVAPQVTPTTVPTATPIVSNNDKNWALVIDANDNTLIADGGDNTVLTFKMINTKTQSVDTTANDITLDVYTSFGQLSNSSVTIKNGTGTLVLNSEFSAKELKTKVTADISRQSNNGTDLVGKVSGETYITFEPFKISEDKSPKLVKAESDQADRVTLFFDREVTIDDFVVKNAATGTYKVVNGKQVFYSTNANSPVFTVSQKVAGKTVKYPVVGMATVKNDDGTVVNKKALQLLIAESSALDDNNTVNINYTNKACGINTNTSFILTDTKKPQFTAIESVGMKKVKITFSEAIPATQNTTNAKYTINGSIYKDGDVTYGTYNPATAEDNRSVVMLTLGKDDKGLQSYFKPGTAKLAVTNVIDYAGITDIGRNIISNQSKDFTVTEDANRPTATITVESPEQYRIKFTGNKDGKECPVVFTEDKNKTQISAVEYFSKALKVKVDGKYISLMDTVKTFNDKVELGTEEGKKVKPVLLDGLNSFLKVTQVSEGEFVVELTEDWTKFYTTSLTNRNYYNDLYEFDLTEDTVYNDNNGLTNDEVIRLNLNGTGSPMNQQDDVSPQIQSIMQTDEDQYFAVQMSEPVAFSKDGVDTTNITLSETQSLQIAKAEFKGTKANGEIVTFDGAVCGYYDTDTKKKTDTLLQVQALYEQKTIQQLVDEGYGTSWTIALTYVYDDVKNAAETKVASFEVQPTAGLFSIDYVKGTTAAVNGTQNDVITVKFTQGVADTSEALDITRWKLDGYNFPENSRVEVQKESGNEYIGYYVLTFTIPSGTLRTKKSHVLNVDKGIKSIKKNTLIGSFENQFVADAD